MGGLERRRHGPTTTSASPRPARRGVAPDLVFVHADVDRRPGLRARRQARRAGRPISRAFLDRLGRAGAEVGGAAGGDAAHLPSTGLKTRTSSCRSSTSSRRSAPSSRRRQLRRVALSGTIFTIQRRPVGPALARVDIDEAAARRDRLRRPGLSAHPRRPARATTRTPPACAASRPTCSGATASRRSCSPAPTSR